jgi:hypothetical protein
MTPDKSGLETLRPKGLTWAGASAEASRAQHISEHRISVQALRVYLRYT